MFTDFLHEYLTFFRRAYKRNPYLIAIIGIVYASFVIYYLFLQSPFTIYKIQQKQPTTNGDKQLSKLQEQVGKLTFRLTKIEHAASIASFGANLSSKTMNDRLEVAERQLFTLNEVIADNPNKTLTMKLLREDQNRLRESLTDVKTSQKDLNSKVDTFIFSFIAVPVITIVLTLVGGLIVFLYSYHMKHKKV